MRIIIAVAVAAIAFFELCLTGRADCAWRLARKDQRRESIYYGKTRQTADRRAVAAD